MYSAKNRDVIFQASNFTVVFSATQGAQCPARRIQEIRETSLIPKAIAVLSQTNSNEQGNKREA